jgi:hypothetical protein
MHTIGHAYMVTSLSAAISSRAAVAALQEGR